MSKLRQQDLLEVFQFITHQMDVDMGPASILSARILYEG